MNTLQESNYQRKNGQDIDDAELQKNQWIVDDLNNWQGFC